MKYSIGDEVMIRSDLDKDIHNHLYYMDDGTTYIGINQEMRECAGMTAYITGFKRASFSNNFLFYDLNICDGEWCWADEMFENIPITELEQSDTPLQGLLGI